MNKELRNYLECSLARRYGLDNYPTFAAAEVLHELDEKIITPLSEAWGSPVDIIGGYRCKELSVLYGESAVSEHTLGYAANILPRNGKLAEFIAFAAEWLQSGDIAFDRAFKETDRDGNNSWHISLYGENKEQRRLVL